MMRKCIRAIPAKVMHAITSFSWPGNVPELHNFIEGSVILSRDETLAAPLSDFAVHRFPERFPPNTTTWDETGGDPQCVTRLQAFRLGGAAQHLELKQKTSQRKMQRLVILKSEFISE
jgi:transcriptional regulator with GAF, ATPase, and Fis domain